MADKSNKRPGWTTEERDGIKALAHMAGILFLTIVIAGVVAAVVSSSLGTL